MRLIDADEMLQDESEAYMKAQVALSRKGSDATVMLNQLVHKKLQMLIADTPTIDAVPVVRCKDCKYIGPLSPTDDYNACTHKRAMVYAPVDGFCCWGERRTDE